MTDIVYILGSDSHWQNNEIRYSLRSIEKYLHDYGKVYVIGIKPYFLKNVIHIPANDLSTWPANNIKNKLTIACNTPEISDSFLFFNDDHYLLYDYIANQFPYYYDGYISSKIEHRGIDRYGLIMRNADKYLTEKNLPTKFFDVHTPILINKKQFLQHVTNGPEWSEKKSYIIKSIYANSLNIEGEWMQDCKPTTHPPIKAKIFSTAPHVTSAIKRFLNDRFPNPSQYEQD